MFVYLIESSFNEIISFHILSIQLNILQFFYFKAFYSKIPPNKVQLDIPQGRIIGTESILPNEKPFYSFQGVPYAEPPIGPLRFAVKNINNEY